ncbi:hypothetical protein NC651_039567 [Populus alba x Populus x berolinensis]|nr:hypothetical protein NC651_039567 [Populus alba x Populus x berolinensis]
MPVPTFGSAITWRAWFRLLGSAPPSSPSYHGIFLFLKSLICYSLQQIGITNCQMLKRLAIHLPLLENGQLSHPPSLRVMEYIQKNGESQLESLNWRRVHLYFLANQEDEEDELFYDEAAINSVLDESKSRSRNITKYPLFVILRFLMKCKCLTLSVRELEGVNLHEIVNQGVEECLGGPETIKS